MIPLGIKGGALHGTDGYGVANCDVICSRFPGQPLTVVEATPFGALGCWCRDSRPSDICHLQIMCAEATANPSPGSARGKATDSRGRRDDRDTPTARTLTSAVGRPGQCRWTVKYGPYILVVLVY